MVRLLFLALDLRLEEDEAECVHVRELVFNFADMGHHVLLLSSRASSWSPRPPRPRLTIRPVGGGPTASELIHVLREARAFRPDVIYERRFLPKVSAIVSALRDIPAVVEINGLVDDEIRMQGRESKTILPSALRSYLVSSLFGQLAGVVTVTKVLASEMSRLYGIAKDRLTVIENAANTSLFRPLDKVECRRELGMEGSGRVVCFEGSLYPWHGVDILLRAHRILRERDPHLQLLIVGDGPSRTLLEELASTLELGDAVLFIGRVPYERVPLYIGACDVGVGPFVRERNERIGLSPLKIYEYVACGRPVVVSRLPGVAEWVEEERLGLLSLPEAPEDLAEKVAKVLVDDRLMHDMVTRGPAAVSRAHSWNSVARRILTLCGKLIAEEG